MTFRRVETSSALETLEIFYNATNISSSSSMNWFSPGIHYCNFTGVECDGDFFVTALVVPGLFLTGTVPPEIGRLVHLKRLDLGRNNLFGILPTQLGRLAQLQHLEVNQNNLLSSLPSELGNLNSLKRLLLQSNQFTGMLSADLCRLAQLQVLNLSNNQLQGNLPNCLVTATSLTSVWIKNSQLTGSIPHGLCSRQPINGLDPNPYGCAAIACPPDTYASGGRQTSDSNSCQPCPIGTTSAFLGSSICEEEIVTSPDPRPTVASSSSVAPSHIKLSPLPSGTPTWNLPSLIPSIEMPVYEGPTTELESRHPSSSFTESPSGGSSTDPSITISSFAPTPRPSFLDTKAPLFDTPLIATISPTGLPPPFEQQEQHTPFNSTNWRLLSVSLILSVIAMTTVFFSRRMGRRLFESKRVVATTTVASNNLQEQLPVEPDQVSLESDSGWNDTESSLASIYWQEGNDTTDYDEGDDDDYEPWSVFIPPSTSESADGSCSSGSKHGYLQV
jgi:hypothetical protein